MRTLLISLALLPSIARAEHMAGQVSEAPAIHGMVLLGKEKIFLSHLPMFHAPHDAQVIFSVEIDRRSKAKLDAATGDFFTLVPEEYRLGEMIQKPHSFEAEIYSGHFERGGKLIAEHVRVTNVRVIFSQKLFANEKPVPESKYFAFGSGKEQFMAHLIQGKPNFDQLLLVEGYGMGEISFPDQSARDPFEANTTLKAENGTRWKIIKSIYLEFDDLAH
jgi:hypothetical protein